MIKMLTNVFLAKLAYKKYLIGEIAPLFLTHSKIVTIILMFNSFWQGLERDRNNWNMSKKKVAKKSALRQ